MTGPKRNEVAGENRILQTSTVCTIRQILLG